MSTPLLTRLTEHPGRFPGALLLHGTSETALDTESTDLAAWLLCPGEDPGRTCDSCRRSRLGLHPDLLSLAPEGVQIRVDRVREAIAFGAGRPYESARRVVRISRAELLGVEAANALLKSVEEPGSRLHWILTTTRPESLLPTIRSRCLSVPVTSPATRERVDAFVGGGFSAEDAADLVALGVPPGPDAAVELDEARRLRAEIVEALEAGVVRGRTAALVLLAERLARVEAREIRVFIELVADAALLASGVSPELVRHRAVLSSLSEIARSAGSATLGNAALVAADYPPDTRRGNRRLHFEKVLLELTAGRG